MYPSGRGRAQASSNGVQLSAIIGAGVDRFDFVASPLARTRETMEIVRATLGIPPGFSVSAGDLNGLVTAKTISKYEFTAKQLVVYVSHITPSGDVILKYGLQATMPVVVQSVL